MFIAKINVDKFIVGTASAFKTCMRQTANLDELIFLKLILSHSMHKSIILSKVCTLVTSVKVTKCNLRETEV